MTNKCIPLAWGLATALLLGACAPVTTYSAAEAPKNLVLDSSTVRVDLRFAPGSARLSATETAQLRRLAVTGAIGTGDRVTIGAAGNPALAGQRVASVSAVLLNYGIIAGGVQLADVAPNHAVVEVMRTMVTLPACPNWSKPSQPDFANAPSSNFACSTETNLGLMVANPTDLASARPLSGTPGQPAAAAVQRYLTDKVTPLPTANGATPFSAAASQTPSSAPATGGP